jgi:hypothetical protein
MENIKYKVNEYVISNIRNKSGVIVGGNIKSKIFNTSRIIIRNDVGNNIITNTVIGIWNNLYNLNYEEYKK